MKTRLGLILIGSMIFSYAAASDWFLIAKGNDSIVFVDKSSISSKDKYLKAWLIWDYTGPKKMEYYPYKEYRSTKSLYYLDCSSNSIAISQSVNYLGNFGAGESVDSYSQDISKLKFSDVAPDTIGETILKYVCVRGASKERKK